MLNKSFTSFCPTINLSAFIFLYLLLWLLSKLTQNRYIIDWSQKNTGEYWNLLQSYLPLLDIISNHIIKIKSYIRTARSFFFLITLWIMAASQSSSTETVCWNNEEADFRNLFVRIKFKIILYLTYLIDILYVRLYRCVNFNNGILHIFWHILCTIYVSTIPIVF